MPRTPFGEYLVTRRNALRPKLTQNDVAKELTKRGFPHTNASIAHWESQHREILPNFNDTELIRAIAEILQTTPYTIREKAGFNEGIDAPLSPTESRFNSAFHLLPLERQELYLSLIESEIKTQHRK